MSEGADPLVRNALFVLVDNKRLDALADVVAVVHEADRRARRQLELELTTAVPIDDAEAEQIRAQAGRGQRPRGHARSAPSTPPSSAA